MTRRIARHGGGAENGGACLFRALARKLLRRRFPPPYSAKRGVIPSVARNLVPCGCAPIIPSVARNLVPCGCLPVIPRHPLKYSNSRQNDEARRMMAESHKYFSPWQRHGLKRCPNINLRPERAIYLFSTICCPFRAQICRVHFLPMALPWAKETTQHGSPQRCCVDCSASGESRDKTRDNSL